MWLQFKHNLDQSTTTQPLSIKYLPINQCIHEVGEFSLRYHFVLCFWFHCYYVYVKQQHLQLYTTPIPLTIVGSNHHSVLLYNLWDRLWQYYYLDTYLNKYNKRHKYPPTNQIGKPRFRKKLFSNQLTTTVLSIGSGNHFFIADQQI